MAKLKKNAHFWRIPQTPIVRAALLIGVITLTAAALVEIFEADHNQQFSTFWDSVWWVIVTISTVGYGDKVPVTPIGRGIGVVIIFLGMASISIITATIASIFVTKKIREGKGLQEIKIRNHVLICGWNSNTEQILTTLDQDETFSRGVVLINQLSEEVIAELLTHFNKLDVKFVRGDFTRENILTRAAAQNAYAAVILPDTVSEITKVGDERTILTTLSLKTINPKIKVYAHIRDRENLSHLRKARADEVIVSDAHSGYLLANYIASPGVPQFVEQLFSGEFPVRLKRRMVPAEMIGREYGKLKAYYKENGGGILLGIGHIAEPFDISDLMSDDYSYLDEFIMRKFHEAGRGSGSGEQVEISFNPPDDTQLGKNDFFIAIESKG